MASWCVNVLSRVSNRATFRYRTACSNTYSSGQESMFGSGQDGMSTKDQDQATYVRDEAVLQLVRKSAEEFRVLMIKQAAQDQPMAATGDTSSPGQQVDVYA